MIRRNKKIASIILIGLALGVVGCNNNIPKEDVNKSKLSTEVSKNNVEGKKSNNKEKENISKEDKRSSEKIDRLENSMTVATNESNTNQSNVNKPSNTEPNNTNQSNVNKPSNTEPNNTNQSNVNKPSNTESNNTNQSNVNKPSNTKPNNTNQSNVSKPSNTKPNNTNQSNTSKPSNTKPNNTNQITQKRTWQYMSSLSQETFSILNSYRKSNGIEPLKYNSSEQARANKQAEYNARTETGNHDFMQISILSTVDNTAQQFINRWIKSASHKSSMLESSFVEGAVSVYKDSNSCYYVVASFSDNW
ncbi:hypothetical protein QRW90_16655 [Clostridioides difficile]|uniref:CAP domain-containing protein n=3 Tax=Clostridioides difficile TaxID=1496 RepID=UPI001266B81E|nr:CAP domain-containing protein [Clostridioides difficile]MDL5120613.1 hypothetical protein [Clostridioides difficile]QFS33411.1 hypothetical protein FTB24_19435 [Clostridioides difficile]QIF80180.1 hypothetical protein EUU24_17055 [Clostridioides difficile]